jgi:copper transporter 1
LIQTVLHIVQFTASYWLMLVFMTYNVWLCLAVVLGAGSGYLLFGSRRPTSVEITDHCG